MSSLLPNRRRFTIETADEDRLGLSVGRAAVRERGHKPSRSAQIPAKLMVP
jgi:hypothetical protein